MRIRFHRTRIRLALSLLALAILCFGVTWATWSPPPIHCERANVSTIELRECMVKQARMVEPSREALVTLLLGIAALTASGGLAARATRRMLTVAEAVGYLNAKPGDVRKLIDAGTLDVYERDVGTIYLNPEQVHRFAAQPADPA